MVAHVLDTVLRGGRAVLPDGATIEADIGIAGGRIEASGERADGRPAPVEVIRTSRRSGDSRQVLCCH